MHSERAQRLFIALPCPLTPPIAAVLDELRSVQHDAGAGLRVVNADTLHVTLKFLGAVQPALLAPVRQALDATFTGLRSFALQLRGAGQFPSAVWLGLAPSSQLDELAARCDAAMQQLGFAAEDNAFRPHVTLARLKRGAAFDGREWTQRLRDRSWGVLEARAVLLYRSDTQPDGARYSVIHTAPLG